MVIVHAKLKVFLKININKRRETFLKHKYNYVRHQGFYEMFHCFFFFLVINWMFIRTNTCM